MITEEHSFIVSQPLEGTRLSEFLATKLPLYSINTLKGLIEKGSASINENRTSPGALLKEGDAVTVSIPEGTKKYTPHPLPVEVLYEDEHTLVINKPAGLAVIPEGGKRRQLSWADFYITLIISPPSPKVGG